MDPLAGGDMLVDDYDNIDEKQDVAIIPPEDPMEGQEKPVLANDYAAMRAKVLPNIPDLETGFETEYTWKIENWRNLSRREHGPTFQCGNYPWRVLFFPFGNNVDHASFYLEHGFDSKPPEDWYACAQFALVLWNENDPSIYVHHTANHRFTAEEGDWGFTRFAELRKMFAAQWEDHDRPLVEDNAVNCTVYVRIVKDPTGVLWHNFINYDSKKETGMVGLRNQGATCYLNSLLQSLFFTNAFRKAVYLIPTEHEAERSNSAHALQRLFYLLQTHKFAVSTQELTASFGWDTKQIFEQQDVQEFSRILMERMEERMKGTEAENALAKLFVGKMKTYISCINVNYESSRTEDFWDIQLNVSGNKNLHDSFRDYIQVETMDGENKYYAEGHGLQDAKKGVIFESFPQVLHLQLKRFEYDINRDAMMKVNDRYEFPEIFDASPYLSEDADRSEPYIYQLHGVLVHSGDFNAGHYYAFLKPTKDGHFYKFDDDRVTRATLKEAMDDNFGGDYAMTPNGMIGAQRNLYTRTTSTKRSMSAYMLVYIRQSRLDTVLDEVRDADIPAHIGRRLTEERALIEQRRKEREEAHLYLPIVTVTDANYAAYQGFDLTNWDTSSGTAACPKPYRVLKTTTVGDFVKMVADDIGENSDRLRPWVMVNRQNRTVRPDQPLTDNTMTVEEAYNKHGTKNSPFRLWIEVAEASDDGSPGWSDHQVANGNAAVNQSGSILIFLKYFDSEQQTLHGAGHVFLRRHDKVQDLGAPILKSMGWPSSTNLKLFEEIKHSMIEPMKPKSTLHQAELQDGDIVCFQRSLSEKESAAISQVGGYVDAREFYDYLLNRINVKFSPKIPQNIEGEAFELTLSKKMTYDQYAAKVGEHLHAPPTHIRFSTVNATTGKPKTVVKRSLNATLQQTLSPQYSAYGNNNQLPNALYYEVLELSLGELETKKNVKITWLSEGIAKEETYDILVPKNGVIGDLLPALQKKANLDDSTINNLRVYEAHGGKVYKELSSEYSVASVNEFVTLYAERIPEEELNAAEGDRIIYAFHFDRETNKPHGVPFRFVVKPGEIFKETKERLSKRTAIKGKVFEKIKFALVQQSAYSKPIYISDDDILSDMATRGDDLLGLDHVNKSRSFWNRGDSIFIR
ncbi:ubiquitin thiolesterase [Xylona heveae TC161]|uniref:ubiquitinyl hydrolase 1 n=1 Tax=Xylona heveae (strain CBS 132557 / TC161) TaxID=1328760 RepID=A0A165AEF0_XYLHT|nr:ubiquitin thiolesterase [Xylona heveae TC161]KZF20341.1 ubiquitin thiolesterase [Xylona heveae TC161]